MRFAGKTFLVTSFVATFFTLLILITLKFQFLDSSFWIDAFRKNAVYQSLEVSIGSAIQDSFEKEGTHPQEALEIANVFTAHTIQDVIEKNIESTLKFVNRETGEIVVYFPLDKLPGDIRNSLQINSSEISLDYLLKTFGSGSSPIGSEFFVLLRNLKSYIDITLVLTLITLFVTLLLIYKIEEKGRRLVTTWISLVFSGTLTLLFMAFANIWVASTQANLSQSGESAQKVLAKLLPPVIAEVFNLWTILAIIAIILSLFAILLTKGGQGDNFKKQVKNPAKIADAKKT